MRITQRQLRQIIKEEMSGLREADGPSWSEAKSQAKDILVTALRAKYADAIKKRRFNVRELNSTIEEGLEMIINDLDEMSKHPDEI